MEGIREYLFGVIAAGVMCAIVSQLCGKDSLFGIAVKLIAGIFMLLALVSPLTNIRLQRVNILTDISQQAEQITQTSADSSRESMAAIIKEQTQAYILDKAESLGVALSVDVTLSEAELPEPIGITISGSVSPYSKKILSETIAEDLGIGMEAQKWN